MARAKKLIKVKNLCFHAHHGANFFLKFVHSETLFPVLFPKLHIAHTIPFLHFFCQNLAQ